MYAVERQWDAKDQILMSEASQVKLRAIQTETFENPREAILRGVVATMQDLDFLLEVVDTELGVVSGKKLHQDGNDAYKDIFYTLYDDDELLLFGESFRTWGPFEHRKDLVRLTVTVRTKGESRHLVRASVQYDLRAVEDPAVYQKFFNTLRKSLFLSSN
jgi:hypothetical protein